MSQTIDLDNPEFQDIWKLISYTRQSVFMTGKAGTGKSTFLRHIVENTKKRTVVLAPTGIAAVNAGGVTLHSFSISLSSPCCPTTLSCRYATCANGSNIPPNSRN